MDELKIFVRAERNTLIPIIRITLLAEPCKDVYKMMLGIACQMIEIFTDMSQAKLMMLDGGEKDTVPPRMNAVGFTLVFPTVDIADEVMKKLNRCQ